MATIQASIQLKDGMSPALRAIDKTLTNVVATFDRLEAVLNRALGTNKINATNTQLGKTQSIANRVEQEINQAAAAERRFQANVEKTLGAIYRQQTNQIRLTAAIRKTPPAIQQAATAQEKLNTKISRGAGLMSGLAGKVAALAGAYMGVQTAGGIIGTADQLTMTNARLNMMNDGLQTTAELEDKIYQAAMRSRGGFMETADAVAKLGLRAGNIFRSNDETIAFTETLNKMFVIAGASSAEMSSATLQLTQALGAGVLRGEEFNAVFEAAPNVMQAVADYINQPIGKLKELASDGKISAKVVKNALFAATEKVNKQFEDMPYTWAQVWQTIKNYTLKATRPILQAISDITKSQRFIRFANGVGNAISRISGFFQNVGKVAVPVLGAIFDALAGVFNFINDNWSLLAPIICGVTAAFIAFKTPVMLAAIWSFIATTATKAWTATQAIFNAVMAANPVMLVVLAVIALIAVVYLVIAAINKFTGSSISATGVICGAFNWLGHAIANIFIGIYNIGYGIVQAIVNAWNWCGENIDAIFYNIGVWWDNLWADAWVGLCSFVSTALKKLAELAQKFKPLTDKLNIDLSGLTEAANNAAANASRAEASKRAYKKTTAFKKINWNSADYFDLSDAYDSGYKWGEEKGTQLENFMKGLNFTELGGDQLNALREKFGAVDKYGNPINSGGADNLNDIGKALSGALGQNPALDEIAKNTGKTAKNTEDINGKLSVNDDEMNYIRKLAQRETINRYTRSHINLHMTNNNQIKSGMDIKAVARKLAQEIQAEIAVSPDGIRL